MSNSIEQARQEALERIQQDRELGDPYDPFFIVELDGRYSTMSYTHYRHSPIPVDSVVEVIDLPKQQVLSSVIG